MRFPLFSVFSVRSYMSSSSLSSGGVIFTYPNQLRRSILQRRYKRFLADVEWCETGIVETVHCPNTGSMLNLTEPVNILPQCVCSVAANNTKRKYAHTLEMIQSEGAFVGVHSALANKMVENALLAGLISECKGFQSLKREVEVKMKELSKIDFELSFPGGSKMLLEVKSVTLRMVGASSVAVFPDCVSERGQKHLRCLTTHVQNGGSAGILFLIQRNDITEFSACDLDPQYVFLLHQAFTAGVVILPYRCALDPDAGTVTLLDRVPFVDTYVENELLPKPSQGEEVNKKTQTKKRKTVDNADGKSTKVSKT